MAFANAIPKLPEFRSITQTTVDIDGYSFALYAAIATDGSAWRGALNVTTDEFTGWKPFPPIPQGGGR